MGKFFLGLVLFFGLLGWSGSVGVAVGGALIGTFVLSAIFSGDRGAASAPVAGPEPDDEPTGIPGAAWSYWSQYGGGPFNWPGKQNCPQGDQQGQPSWSGGWNQGQQGQGCDATDLLGHHKHKHHGHNGTGLGSGFGGAGSSFGGNGGSSWGGGGFGSGSGNTFGGGGSGNGLGAGNGTGSGNAFGAGGFGGGGNSFGGGGR